MKTLAKKAFTNKPLMISLGVIILAAIIYFLGRGDGKGKGTSKTEYVAGGDGVWRPDGITNKLFNALEGGFDSYSTKNAAFGGFMALSDDQKLAVINDWEERYKGTSQGMNWGTWGTLYESIQEEVFVGSEMYRAIEWMESKGIN